MMSKVCLFSTLLVLSSCTSPPQPPRVGDSHRRPVNAAAAIDLQACTSELHNTRLANRECRRSAEEALESSRAAAGTGMALPAAPLPNAVYSIRFDFNSARVASGDLSARMISEAKQAPLIVLSGRTDGSVETAAEGRIARARAEAVRTDLIRAGVEAARIRTTWQPVGDLVADNRSQSGRRLNRRVEIEVYRTAPRREDADADVQS